MDSARFDDLLRILASGCSRRATLAALANGVVGAGFLALLESDAEAKKKRKRKPQRRARAATISATCCKSDTCTPGPGKNLSQCCFERQNLSGKSFRAANLGQTNFSGANLTDADFRGANLGKTCFVDAVTTGAKFAGANIGTAIFCRTQTSNGEDNSGCDRGTPCCPTCDEQHPCGAGEICCEGRCVTDECCGGVCRGDLLGGQDCGEGGECGPDQTCVDGNCICTNPNFIACGALCCNSNTDVCEVEPTTTTCFPAGGSCPVSDFCNDSTFYACANNSGQPPETCVCAQSLGGGLINACVIYQLTQQPASCDPCESDDDCGELGVCIAGNASEAGFCGCNNNFCVLACPQFPL